MYPIHTYGFNRGYGDVPWWFAEASPEHVAKLVESPVEALWAMQVWTFEADQRVFNGTSAFAGNIDFGLLKPPKKPLNGWGRETQPGEFQDDHNSSSLAAVLFHGLTQMLVFVGEELAVPVPHVWDFYCASTDSATYPNAASPRPTSPEIARSYELAWGDLYRLQWKLSKEIDPDTKTDTPKFMTIRSSDVLELTEYIRRNRNGGKSEAQLARDFVGDIPNRDIKAANLLRSARRHPERLK